MHFTLAPAGDSALTVVFADVATAQTSALARQAAAQLDAARIAGVTELLPALCSLMVCYDPLALGYNELAKAITDALRTVEVTAASSHTVIDLPVCYGGAFGPDLAFVAERAGLTENEVVALHAGRTYPIDMLGFLPGFAYLSGLDERLYTPRLAVPRTRIEAGSVGIGGAQTGVYPLASPGGWHIIGRTPVRLFDPARTRPILLAAGDCLRFIPVTPERYADIERMVAANAYSCNTHVEEAGH